jgi:hypothetical protein
MYRCHNVSSTVLKVARVQLWHQVEYKSVSPCFLLNLGYLRIYRCHNGSSTYVKVARVQLWQQVDYKCVAPCFEQVFGYVWEHTGATMDRLQLSILNEVSFDTKSSAGVFLNAFCNILVLCGDTGATSWRVQLWRLHEFRFYSNLSTGLFFFMFSARFAFSVKYWCHNDSRTVVTVLRVHLWHQRG